MASKPSRSLTDIIVITFVILVAVVLLLFTVTAVILVLFTDKDVGPFIALITNVMTHLVSALVGFIAGRTVAAPPGEKNEQ